MTIDKPRLMSLKEASTTTSLSRTMLSILHRADMFPKPVSLGERRIAFVRAEVEAWIDQRIAARK